MKFALVENQPKIGTLGSAADLADIQMVVGVIQGIEDGVIKNLEESGIVERLIVFDKKYWQDFRNKNKAFLHFSTLVFDL